MEDNQRLVILQTRAHFEKYLKSFRDEKDLILAIGPESFFQCEEKNLNHLTLNDLYEVEQYEKDQIESNLIIKNLIVDLNNYSFNQKPSYELEVGNYFGLQIWIIIGQILYNFSICKMLFKKFNNSNILIFKNAYEKENFTFRPDPINLLANIIVKSNLFSQENIELIELNRSFNLFSFRKFIPNLFFYYIKLLRDKLRVYNFSIFKTGKKRLALIGGGYEWFGFSKDKDILKTYITKIERIRPPKVKSTNFPKILNLINKNVFKDTFFYDFKNLSNYIGSYTEFFIKKKPLFDIKTKKYDAFISSVLTFPEENFLAHIAVKNNLPFYIWQHGERGQTKDDSALYAELLYATNYLMYADKVKINLENFVGKNFLNKLHSVGTVDKKISWKKDKKDKILYATGKWLLTSTPFTDTIDPDYRQYKAQRYILDYLNELTSKEIIFKANNTSGFNTIPYKEKYSNVSFDFKNSFISHLKSSDVVILDTPATTLIEACLTEIPIFVLDGRNIYREYFLELIKKRVVWCKTTKELKEKLNLFFKHGTYEANTKDESYRKEFIISNDKINSYKEILKVIEK